ncbi:phage tail protein [Bacillus inaquosorum]|uniref:phage tail spike protein n=1 Tax=Bacillus inaquosorum TaxID=483913 RepID=UPI002280C7B4|nr:phage tail spike protein [Bacillus inaquosorum]MCY8247508.1 phage tail protein [Bacillus inaquosorum]MCY8251538.1 phage tail protein [Bacillus inaquosorum]
MADMYILSPDDQVLTVLSSDGQEACRFWDAKYKEELNKGSSFSFVADASHPDARYLFEENQVIFRDKDGILRLFVIKELDDTDENSEVNTLVTCEAAMMELAETFVKDFRPTDKTAQYVLDNVLARSRWVAEVSAELGTNSTTFYKKTALECIAEVINIWGGELQDSIEFDGNKITKRIIKILPRRGKDSGKRFEIDKDTENIKRTVISYPLTALWGYGASIASTDEDGEETGGYSRFIDFSEVEWKKSKGDPVDKPLGQEWVGDPDLLKRLGRLKNGELIHREGQYNNEDITDPAELLKATYNHLITTASKTEVNYELSVQLLQNVPGYEHEHVELGDTTIAIDRNFAIPVETSQRIISMEYDITDPDNTCVVEIGQFLSVLQGDDRIDQIENILDKNRGTWERKPDAGEVTDGSFPDKKPPVPSNVEVKSLFQNIALTWDYDPSSYIAAYEIYASQIKGFTPLTENRIFRGKTSGYEHFTGVNEVWYYRLRAINTRGTASDFTDEFSATTKRILTNDILFGAVTADRLADLAVTADKLSRDFSEANILPGSLLRASDINGLNSASISVVKNGEHNELTATKTKMDNALFGISTSPRKTLSLVKGQTYTISFELKRGDIPGITYLNLRSTNTSSENNPINTSSISDLTKNPTDQFVRVDLSFESPLSSDTIHLLLGGSVSDVTAAGSFSIRKLQIRRGLVKKEYTFSPFDVLLTDGSVTSDFIANAAIGSAHIQNAAINSANIADAAITSAKIAEAAVGTAAIQNAAITKAHLKTAIIDTAHIIDGAITNAKIGSLSADKITSGTIKAIDITGSLIKGGRFEPLNESSAYKSYIEGNKIYQRFDYSVTSGEPWKRYDEMTITSGQISMVTGGRDTGTDVPLRYLNLSDASINMSGNKSQSGYAEIQMYCNDWDALKGSDSSAWLRMKKGGTTTMYMGSYVPSNLTDNYFSFNTIGSKVTNYVGNKQYMYAEEDLLLRAKTGINIQVHNGTGGIDLVPGGESAVTMRAGNSPGKHYTSLLGIEVDQSIVDTHGALNTNAIVRLMEKEITMPSTGDAHTGVGADVYILDISSIENVFLILPTVYGSYADHVHAHVTSQSSTSAFRVWLRGTGSSTAILGKTFKVRFAVFIEPK